MSRFNPSNQDLSENPPSAENLLRGFHGRKVNGRRKSLLPIDLQDLSRAECLGRSNTIYYVSDKRDPKDPKGEGAQGHMKRFYHDQRPESYFYVITCEAFPTSMDSFLQMLVEQAEFEGVTAKARKKKLVPKGPLPDKLVDLGDLEKVMLSIEDSEYEVSFVGYKLYVWNDMKTLMGLPIDSDGGVVEDANVYLWASKHTKVNWRGIID
jgi:hypothetical protein